jgi:lycopene beta-cyclase
VSHDVVLVGGGLACGLAALALRRRRPRLRLALVEAAEELGGNHTWSFHGRDLDDEGAALVDPLVVRRWRAVEVAFPDHRRRLDTGYASVTSASLARAVRAAMTADGSDLYLGRKATRVEANHVVLADGTALAADLVLDGRGPGAPPRWPENAGFQKFLGLEVQVTGAHPFDPDTALVMDARVPQTDGYRFVYVLPLDRDRLLVEDTYYADGPQLDRPALRARVLAYLRRQGVTVGRVLREEAGVLPLPLLDEAAPPLGSPVRLGARGGWGHPTTGYTLPWAAQVAGAIAAAGPVAALPALAALHRRWRTQRAFACRLNRLLFRAVDPDARWQVLSRFYRLPQATIERFYALDTTIADRARVVLGRPPRGLSLAAAYAAWQAV